MMRHELTNKKTMTKTKGNPRDLWSLKHWLHFWQLITTILTFFSDPSIKSDPGHRSQFLRCFQLCLILKKFLPLAYKMQLRQRWIMWTDHITGGKYENLCWASLESSPYMQILYKNQNTHFWKSAKGNYTFFHGPANAKVGMLVDQAILVSICWWIVNFQ